MLKLISKYHSLLLQGLAFIFLVSGILSGIRFRDEDYNQKDARIFERILHKKERLLKDEFQELEALFAVDAPTEVLDRKSSEYQELATSQGVSIFYYDHGFLRYWSDHSVPVFNRWRPRFNLPFTSLRNADYVTVFKQLNGGLLVGMIEVKTHFPFQNEVLINGFQHDFKLDDGVAIRFLEGEDSEPIYNQEGAYLFSLDFSESDPVHKGLRAIAVTSLFLFIILQFAAFCAVLRRTSLRKKYMWIGLITVLITGSAFMVLKYSFPTLLTDSDLFQPELLASRFIPSLGALIVFSVWAAALAAIFYLHGNLEGIRSHRIKGLLALLLFVGSALLLLLIDQLISVLILDSSISFEAHRVTTITGYTAAGLLVIIIWFVILGLFIDKAIVLWSGLSKKTLIIGSFTMSLVMLGAMVLPGAYGSWSSWIAILLLLGSHLYLRYHIKDRIPFSKFIFLLLIISVFMTLRFQHYNQTKTERHKEVELVKLSSEHDPVAEMLFAEMSMAIRNDSIFAQYMNRPYIAIEQVAERLRRNYMSGYWTKYDLRVTVCRPADSLYVEPPVDESYHCFTFFEEMILESGIQIAGSDFYFLDNLNGKISYLGSIPYFRADSEHRVFIELDSKILSEELGYPELLLDDDFMSFTNADFSFAKYHGGNLITQDGEFPYRRTSDFYTSGEEVFERITLDKYDHAIYNVDELNTIIVGSPTVTLVDTLISFSYIFALTFLLLALTYLVTTVRIFNPTFNWNFKNRIQYSMIGILFLTFVLICSGTIYFIVLQYRVQHNDNLRNTMRSVYIELIHKVEYEEDLSNWSSESYYSLDELLIKFSNVFNSDINLYDEDGNLLATSRSEIFNQQLLSRRMNRLVFENLSAGNASEFIHNEHIGEMKYISAYVPLLNSENKFLAYLNLPYFTQSGALTRDVTNLVVAVINIYMILMLLILLVSVILADRITQPLRMIQNRIAQVSLSEKNEMIHYNRSDEIRGLVEEYNYMVKELERSAGLLAQSERESAWREMAKQIAHEIKNPLTPMKLNVQHLQRTIEEGKDDPDMVDRISATLIEQIDSLSAIANEFSDFAKMPRARNARVNLVNKLKSLLQLFETTDKARITLDLGNLTRVEVIADKEQLMRVFINLIKNGMQSIPEGRDGVIRIKLETREGGTARITVSDNGKGIKEEIRDKLFQPNFTTKSGGMGMGLAISYNIIRSLGGRIWYDTILDVGTTFFIELPQSVEKR